MHVTVNHPEPAHISQQCLCRLLIHVPTGDGHGMEGRGYRPWLSQTAGRTGNFTVLVTVASTALARTPPPEPLSCLASRARRWRLVSHRSTMATGPQIRAARTRCLSRRLRPARENLAQSDTLLARTRE